MKRKLFMVLAWVCLVLAAGVLVLWPISLRMSPGVIIHIGSVRIAFGAVGGSIFGAAMPSADYVDFDGLGGFGVRWVAERYANPNDLSSLGAWARFGFVYTAPLDGAYAAAVPAWFFIALMVSAAALFWRMAHPSVRSPHACPACGYDLRGSPAGGSCPECGAARPSPLSAPVAALEPPPRRDS